MNHINRTIFSITGAAILILSCGFPCDANPVGLSASCTAIGTGVCGNNVGFGFVDAIAVATPPGQPGGLPASATAFVQADDTLTFSRQGLGQGHAFVEFEFVEGIFSDFGGSASASASFDNVSLVGSIQFGTFDSPLLAITFGTPFSFDMFASASEDVSGALAGHPRESEGYLTLIGIQVVNAAGHPLRNIHLTSGSGTIYPLDAANMLPSPEPSSLSLLSFGLIALLFVASRKRFWLQL